MEKAYVYVDESGQETKGEQFVVSPLIGTASEWEKVKALLEQNERDAGKIKKWADTPVQYRMKYVNELFASDALQGKAFYAVYKNSSKPYAELVADAVARAVKARGLLDRQCIVVIDGLVDAEVANTVKLLRARGVMTSTKLVRGAKDESSIFIRVADSICGLVRDIDTYPKLEGAFKKAEKNKLVQKL